MAQTITKRFKGIVVAVPAAVPAISAEEATSLVELHIDPKSPEHKPAFNQEKTYVFYCASGDRSALAALVAMGMGPTVVLPC